MEPTHNGARRPARRPLRAGFPGMTGGRPDESDRPGGMLQDSVIEAARRNPTATAVVGEDGTLTYGELEEYSNRLARTLRMEGCRRGDRVAVLMPKSARTVATFIGILKAGCVYVPLDPLDRLVRTAEILRRSEPRVLLAGDCGPEVLENLESRRALGEATVGWSSLRAVPGSAKFTLDDVARSSGAPMSLDTHPDDLAYMLFTSGERHPLRGVPLTHRNVHGFVAWAVGHFSMGPGDRVPGHSGLALGPSGFDIHATFAAEAELHLVPQPWVSDPRTVLDVVEDRALTVWLCAPATLRHIARHDLLAGRSLSSLRHLAWGGDGLPMPIVHYWQTRLPGVHLTNLYGATETTVASACYTVPDDFGTSQTQVPIGTGCAGQELILLADDLTPVPDGEVGDIYVRGSGLSPGYWRDTEGTGSAFLPDPSTTDGSGRMFRTGDRGSRTDDGKIRFLGRADFQFVGEGLCRLEPAVVEHAILQLPGIAACTVVPVTVSEGALDVVGCAYVPSDGQVLRTAAVSSFLSARLPASMIPSRWLILDELPFDNHGKVDRALIRTLLAGWPAGRNNGQEPSASRRAS